MTITDIDHDEDAREAAVELLRSGEATESDAARLAGVTRQVVHYWAKVAKVDANKAREARLARAWRMKMAEKSGTSKPRRTKADLRKVADKALTEFTAKGRKRAKRR